MSLFQNKSDYFLKGEDQLDVFHLGPHGCDVLFSHYEKETTVAAIINATSSKSFVVNGALALTMNNSTETFHTGDWFDIPAKVEFTLHYLSDCSIIEFWFEPQAS